MRLAARPTLFPRATLSGLAVAEVSCAQIHPMIGCFFRDHSPQALPGGHRPGADPPAHRRRPLAARPTPAAGAGTRRAARHEPQHRARSGARADLLRRAGSPPGRRHLRARLRRSAGNHAGAGAQRGAALPGGTRDDRDRGGAPGCRSPRRQRPERIARASRRFAPALRQRRPAGLHRARRPLPPTDGRCRPQSGAQRTLPLLLAGHPDLAGTHHGRPTKGPALLRAAPATARCHRTRRPGSPPPRPTAHC